MMDFHFGQNQHSEPIVFFRLHVEQIRVENE